MADREPLLFRYQFGALRPVTAAADEFLATLSPGQMVKGNFIIPRGNTRRLAWYWVMLKIACEQLSDAIDGRFTTRMLHNWFKRQLGHATPIVSRKTGEILDYDYDSISFAKMPENDRAEYIDQASELLSRRLGVDVDTLRREAEDRAA
jgi:hypothetical protein